MSTHVVEANKKDTSDTSAVRFSTMHRAKGLEFDQVLVITPERSRFACGDAQRTPTAVRVADSREARRGFDPYGYGASGTSVLKFYSRG